nr:hypothetical protein [Mycoplasmopsis bovis]
MMAHLNYNQRSNFSQWSRKGKVKGSKDFTLLYTTYIPKSQFITDHTKEIWMTILRTFGKCAHGKY